MESDLNPPIFSSFSAGSGDVDKSICPQSAFDLFHHILLHLFDLTGSPSFTQMLRDCIVISPMGHLA
jgi:hypothetical protein